MHAVGWESASESDGGNWGTESLWINSSTQHPAWGRKYAFSICIYVPVLHTSYLCTDVSFSTAVIIIGESPGNQRKHRSSVKPLRIQATLQMMKYSIAWELPISTLTLFNHGGPFSHSSLNFRKFAQRLRFDILRHNSLDLYPLARATINNQ